MDNSDKVPVYIDEIDRMLDTLSAKIPRTTLEIIYLNELDMQKRVYLVLIILGLLMIAFVALL